MAVSSHQTSGNALHTNFDVDYVISYRFTGHDTQEAIANFQNLIQALASVELETEVRNGDNLSILVFVKTASEKRLSNAVYKSRVRDWLHGVRQAQPDRETQNALTAEPLTNAERLRLIHHMIVGPKEDGGAAITPKSGQWKCVEAIFPLHDHEGNKEFLKSMAGKTFLTPEDLDFIRNSLGEKIGYYFAFTQSYFTFLIFPAAFGFSCWLLLGHYSPIYAIVNCLWCVSFVEYWKRQELDLSIRWGVKGVSSIQTKRKGFIHEKEITDPVTGETVQVFPATKRLGRQVLQIPFAFLACLALGTLIATCFGIEIFISEIYSGPLKSVLVFIPTGLLTTLIPTITTLLTAVATRLTAYENYETNSSYEAAMTQKIFVLNFITSYLPIFLTAFVYVPFATYIVPYLDVFSLTVQPFAEDEKQVQAPKASFEINPSRLRNQVFYFTVTAQIVNLAMETIVPLVKRKAFGKYRDFQADRAAKKGGSAPAAGSNDAPEEHAFLTRVRNEAELDDYDVTTDLREMCVQFGYLSLFSVVWPLTAVSFLINNWVEIRGDAFKICVQMKRPSPMRADTIGPWLDSLGFLTWLGSITTAAIVYMFSNDGLGPDGSPGAIKGWALLLAIFFSEHIYILVRLVIRLLVSKIDSPGMQKERAERFMVRKRYLEETIDSNEATSIPPAGSGEKITRASLEEDARQGSVHGSGPQDLFWGRQRGWEETAKVGARMIEIMAPNDAKKDQ